jgi:hypothetical protein
MFPLSRNFLKFAAAGTPGCGPNLAAVRSPRIKRGPRLRPGAFHFGLC